MTEDDERWIADVILARSNPYARKLMFKPNVRLVIPPYLEKEYEKALKLDLKCLGKEPSDNELIKDETKRDRKLKNVQKRKRKTRTS